MRVCVHVCVWTRTKRNGDLDNRIRRLEIDLEQSVGGFRCIGYVDDNSPTLLPDSSYRPLKRSVDLPVYLVQLDQGSNRHSTPGTTPGRSKNHDPANTPSKANKAEFMRDDFGTAS